HEESRQECLPSLTFGTGSHFSASSRPDCSTCSSVTPSPGEGGIDTSTAPVPGEPPPPGCWMMIACSGSPRPVGQPATSLRGFSPPSPPGGFPPGGMTFGSRLVCLLMVLLLSGLSGQRSKCRAGIEVPLLSPAVLAKLRGVG